MSEPDLVTTPEAEASPAISTIGAEGVHECIRYFVASGLALLVDVGVLYLLTSIFGVPYLAGRNVLIGRSCAQRRLGVRPSRLRDPKTEFIVVPIGIVSLSLNELVPWSSPAGTAVLSRVKSRRASLLVEGRAKWLLFVGHDPERGVRFSDKIMRKQKLDRGS